MSTALATVLCSGCHNEQLAEDNFCRNCGQELRVDVLGDHLAALTKKVVNAQNKIDKPPTEKKKLPLSPDEVAKIVKGAQDTVSHYGPIVKELAELMGVPVPAIVSGDENGEGDDEAESL